MLHLDDDDTDYVFGASDSQGELTNPTRETVLADTGELSAGIYLIRVSGGASANAQFQLQHRNAANDANVGANAHIAAVLADSPDVYWRLNELSGLSAADASGNGVTGTIAASGVTYGAPSRMAGEKGALTFDGVAGKVTRASPGVIPNAAIFTVGLWVNIASLVAAKTAVYQAGTMIVVGTDGTVTATADSGAGSTSIASGAGAVVIDTWYHIMFISTGAQLELYIDGASAATPVASTRVAAIGETRVGQAAAAFQAFTADEVAVYPTALTAARVLVHYNAAIGNSRPHVVGFYSLADFPFALEGFYRVYENERIRLVPDADITGTAWVHVLAWRT